jgi:hypothetical protein
MSCHELEQRLEALVAGELDARTRLACEHHLESCAACRELVQLACLAHGGLERPAELTAAILEQTSGDVCADCPSLLAILRALDRELPELRELHPDRALEHALDRHLEGSFVAAVLARTSPRSLRWRREAARVWKAWLTRPRFALEASYLATIILMLLLWIPSATLQALPDAARAAGELRGREALASLDARLDDAGARVSATLAAPGVTVKARLAAGVERATARLGSWLAGVGEGIRTFGESLASLSKSVDREGASQGEAPQDDASLFLPLETEDGEPADDTRSR